MPINVAVAETLRELRQKKRCFSGKAYGSDRFAPGIYF